MTYRRTDRRTERITTQDGASIAASRGKNRYSWLPLLYLTPPAQAFPGTICVKFSWMSMDGQGTKRCRNIAENFNRLSRVTRPSVCNARAPGYRQTTDDRQTEGRVSSRSLMYHVTTTESATLDLRSSSRPHSTATAPWPALISRFADDKRLSWPERLVTYQDGIPANGHPSQY